MQMAFIENELKFYTKANLMDDPKTRRESKKDRREKAGGKYSTKHVRLMETLREKQQKRI
jgi:hypothetical protein